MAYTTTTNLSLQKPIDEHNLVEDINILQASHEANMDLLETYIAAGTVAIATNPSIVTMVGDRIVKLYACSAGSISTITGMTANVPFTMVMMSSGASLAYLDAGTNALLSGDWIPDNLGDSLTLVWDGTSYIEIGRVTIS